MLGEASGQRLSSRRRDSGSRATMRCQYRWRIALAVLGTLVLLSRPTSVGAQQAQPVRIDVSPTIVALPASQPLLGIEVGPPASLPKRSFVSVRGLPANISLSEGHLVGVGSWAVPVSALPTLKANIPVNVSGRSELVISLISMEGSLLAVARSALVIAPQAMAPPPEREPAEPGKKAVPPPAPFVGPELEVRLALSDPPAAGSTAPKGGTEKGSSAASPASPLPPGSPDRTSASGEKMAAQASEKVVEPVTSPAHASGSPPPTDSQAQPPLRHLSTAERELAEKLVGQGERYLDTGNVVGARLFFRRAAEGGFAPAAIRLGATYDPAELSRLQVQGVAPDLAEARKWYERARSLGAPEAEERLAGLGGR